jgi:hypothetical protein
MPECQNCLNELELCYDGSYYCKFCEIGYPSDYFVEEED